MWTQLPKPMPGNDWINCSIFDSFSDFKQNPKCKQHPSRHRSGDNGRRAGALAPRERSRLCHFCRWRAFVYRQKGEIVQLIPLS